MVIGIEASPAFKLIVNLMWPVALPARMTISGGVNRSAVGISRVFRKAKSACRSDCPLSGVAGCRDRLTLAANGLAGFGVRPNRWFGINPWFRTASASSGLSLSKLPVSLLTAVVGSSDQSLGISIVRPRLRSAIRAALAGPQVKSGASAAKSMMDLTRTRTPSPPSRVRLSEERALRPAKACSSVRGRF